jgi:hypothetical protein
LAQSRSLGPLTRTWRRNGRARSRSGSGPASESPGTASST